MRAFVKLREIISTHKKVEEKLKAIENKLKEHDDQIVQIIQVINQLITPATSPKRRLVLQQINNKIMKIYFMGSYFNKTM